MYKNQPYFYTQQWINENEIEKIILFTTASTNKIGITLTKEVQDLYTDDHKISLKEIREEL